MKHTILIVDDSRTVRAMVQQALEAQDYDVVQAENGVEALKKLAQGTPHLLLTDVNMPEMGGIELIRRVRAQACFSTLPILVLTTEFSAEMKQAGRDAGANGWLVKPFDPVQLCATIAVVLERFGSAV